MVDLISEDKVAEMREIFGLFDKDGDGTISLTDLGTIMRSLNYSPTEAELNDIIDEVGKSGNDVIDFPEFVTLMSKQSHLEDAEEELTAAFKAFDRHGNGQINAAEMRFVLTSLGEKLTDEEVDELIRESDKDGDGQLNYDGFVALLSEER